MTHEKDDLSTLVHGMKTVASPFRAFLNDMHQRYASLTDGRIASHIPELASANPDWFGIAVVSTDGMVYEVGDSQVSFTIQAIARPFLYGLALDTHGDDVVRQRVGVEPASNSFDAVISSPASQRIPNPILDAGAIAISSMVSGDDPTSRLNHMLSLMQRTIGHDVQVHAPAFVSARMAGHEYRALAHLMLHFGLIETHIDQTLDLFFQQHAILVTCRDLAVMAATLANGGTNPITGETALPQHIVKNILSMMYTCGMSDFSGEWAHRVGLPARSGISGGIIAVVPQQIGIAVYSPLLTEQNHSLRGIRVIETLSQHFKLHIFDPNHSSTALHDALNERPTRNRPTRNRIAQALGGESDNTKIDD